MPTSKLISQPEHTQLQKNMTKLNLANMPYLLPLHKTLMDLLPFSYVITTFHDIVHIECKYMLSTAHTMCINKHLLSYECNFPYHMYEYLSTTIITLSNEEVGLYKACSYCVLLWIST